MKTFRVLVGALALWSAATVAQAAPVAIDFSTLGYSEGQLIEGVTILGATLVSEGANLTYTNLYGAGIYDPPGASGDIQVTFAGAVDSVSVRAGDGAGDNDAFAISAYAFGTNAFLGTFNSPVFGGANEPEWYTLNVSGLGLIGKIIIDPGNGGVLPGSFAGSGGVIVTDLNFNTAAAAVPEPATLSLVGVGLGLVAARRRSRRA